MIVHLLLDDFVVAAERHLAPSLAGRPLVIGGARGADGRVAAASAEARACGVETGMRLREAALRCPRARFLPGDLERQHDLRGLVDERVRALAGPVAWTAIDEAVFEAGEAAGPAAARRLAEAVQQDLLAGLGLTASVGLARLPLAARVAARVGRPRGLVVVLPGYDRRFLADAALDELDAIDSRTRARLAAHDVASLGALADLPVERAVAMVGHRGGALVRLARGEPLALPRAPALPRRLCRQRAPLVPGESLEETMARLADDLAAGLTRAGGAASVLSLRVEPEDGGPGLSQAGPLKPPTAAAEPLRAAARRLLGRVAPGSLPVRLVSLAATGLVPMAAQGELFERQPAAWPVRAWPGRRSVAAARVRWPRAG